METITKADAKEEANEIKLYYDELKYYADRKQYTDNRIQQELAISNPNKKNNKLVLQLLKEVNTWNTMIANHIKGKTF